MPILKSSETKGYKPVYEKPVTVVSIGGKPVEKISSGSGSSTYLPSQAPVQEQVQVEQKTVPAQQLPAPTVPVWKYDPITDLQTRVEVNQRTGVVEAPKPITFAERLQRAKIIAESEGLYAAGKALITPDRTKQDLKLQQEQTRINQQAKIREGGLVYAPSQQVAPGTEIRGGTTQKLQYQETPTKVLLRDASLGDKAALQAANIRAEKEVRPQLDSINEREFKADQMRLDSKFNELQNQVNAGNKSAEVANAELKEYAKQLDVDREKRVSEQSKQVLAPYQQTLDKVAARGQISRTVLSIPKYAALGYLLAPAAASLPVIVGRGVAVATGIGVAAGATKLTYDVAKGKSGVGDVAEFVVPLAAFAAGAGIRFKGMKVDAAKLDNAIKTSEVIAKGTPRILTTEQQINVLEISAERKVDLINKLRSGQRIAVQEYKITNRNPEYREIINKLIPSQKIQNVGTTDYQGNFVKGISATKVSIGSGLRKYVEIQGGVSVGVVEEGGIGVIDTLNLRTTKTGELIEVSKTRTPFETKVRNVRGEAGEIIGRGIKTKAYTFEGEKVTAKPEKGITYKDLIQVAESEKFKPTPSTEFNQKEIQRIIGQQVDIVKLGSDKIGVKGKAYFKTEKLESTASMLPEPITFEKSKTSGFRNIKTDIVNKPKEVKFTQQQADDIAKTLKSIYGNQQTTQQQVSGDKLLNDFNKAFSDVAVKPNTKNIIKAVQKGAGEVTKQTKKPSTVLISKQKLNQIEEGLSIDTKSGGLELDKIRQDDRFDFKFLDTPIEIPSPKIKTDTKTGQAMKEIQAQQLNLEQLQKQISPNVIIPPNIIPPTIIPRIPPPIKPFKLPSEKPGAGFPTFKKLKLTKAKSPRGYAASLAAAVAQVKPIKVSRKQYQKLKNTIFTGIEARPLLEITEGTSGKKRKKGVTSVQF